MKQIIERARVIARAKIKEDLVRDSNERLRQVLANDPVEIAQIDRSLRRAHQSTGSVGQVLAVGYVFLMSVLTRGANDFPLVVDSPANPIDRGRRRRVGAMIPELCSQFVGFMINTEYDAFVPAIARTSNRVRYLTHFRKTTGTVPLMSGLPSAGVTQTDTGVLVEGPDYFRDFELTNEDD